MNDIYSFDPNAKVDLDDFVDIIGRNFKQPEEGLGFDNSPSAHMWRTLMWPTRFIVRCESSSCPGPVRERGKMKIADDQPSGLSALDRPNSYIGRSVPRPNLARLTQGRGQYVSDVVLPRMVHVAFVRSPHAHARIKRIGDGGGEAGAGRGRGRHRRRACESDHALGRRADASQGHQIGAAARHRASSAPAGRARRCAPSSPAAAPKPRMPAR